MRMLRTLLVLVVVALWNSYGYSQIVHAVDDAPNTPTDLEQSRVEIAESFGQVPLSFEFNEGQTDEPVRYL